MPSTVVTSFNIHDLFGANFDARRVKAWATTNAPSDTIHDTATGETRIGGGYATIGTTGTGTFSHWAPGATANPLTWQTTYHFDVPDRTAPSGRRTETFGPFTVTATGLLTALVTEQVAVPTATASTFATAAGASATAAATSATGAATSATAAQTARTGAEAARDGAVAIVGPVDATVEGLIKNTGGVGPLTSAALAASIVDLAGVGHMAVSEASRILRSGDDERATLTPDGRTAATLISGQTDQPNSSFILSAMTVADDVTRFKAGTQSKKFTIAVAGSQTAILDPLYPAPAPDPFLFQTASIVRAWVWMDDPTKITGLDFEIYNGAPGGTTPWTRGAGSSQPPAALRYGWNLLSWKASAGSTADWGNVFRVRILTTTNAATAFNIGRVWVESPPKARILFIEDRGYKTFVDNGLASLRSRNIPVNWSLDPALNGTSVGTKSEAITDAQVAAFYAAGDDLSIHAYAGAVSSTMTAAQLREDTLLACKWLQDRGYNRGREFRNAFTQNSAPQHAALRPYYAAYASPIGTASDETWPFLDKWNVGRVSLHATSSAQMDAYFTTLQKTRALFVCYTHGIHIDGGADMTPAQWAYFISKIDAGIAGGWLEGVTFSQLLARSGGVLRA